MKHLLRLLGFAIIPSLVMSFALADPALGATMCSDSGAADMEAADAVEPPLHPPGGELVSASDCTATADCGVHGQIMCSGNSTCSAQDRSCTFGGANINGFVECDGTRTDCPSDTSCNLACLDDYEACLANCTTFFPCASNCRDSYAFCKCNC